jgi:serine/threonine-protein phosphatase 2B catalytic subunit
LFEDKPNLQLLLQHLEAEGRLELDAALTIMIRGRELTAREPNMIDIETPVTIVGDIHGQFFDMVFISIYFLTNNFDLNLA